MARRTEPTPARDEKLAGGSTPAVASVPRRQPTSPTTASPAAPMPEHADDCTPRWRRRPADRPSEIIDAGFRAFGENGLERTRLEDVARHAGVSKGTIYLYFDSKESLFREVVRAKIISVIESAERATEASRDEPGALRRFAVRHWEFVTSPEFQTMYRLVNGELARFPDLARFYGDEVIQRSLRLLTTLIQRGIERGELRQMDPVMAARVFGAMFSTHAVWFERREAFGTFPNETSESVRDALIDFYLMALAVPGQAPSRRAPTGAASSVSRTRSRT